MKLLCTEKQMEREIERRLTEADKWRWMNERTERLSRDLDEVRNELWQLRVKVDPEFQSPVNPGCVRGDIPCAPAP